MTAMLQRHHLARAEHRNTMRARVRAERGPTVGPGRPWRSACLRIEPLEAGHLTRRVCVMAQRVT
jgi:hypothetical protein